MLLHRCRCGKLIPQNMKLCDACTERSSHGGMSRHMEYNLYRRDKRTAAFYVCNDWRKLRQQAIQMYDGIDIYAFYVQHRIMTADMVHHIEEVEDNWDRRLDISNLIPLSNTNHGIISALYKRDEATKRATQEQLRALIAEHWKGSGGIWNVLSGAN